jgi:DNA helicase-2/ATP-dependent DNA helicase PcrA
LRKETASPEIGLFGAAGPATVRQRIAAFGDGEGEPSRDAELLEPLAKRHGTDVEGFLRDLALGAEIDTWDPRADRLSLLTLHAAKGLEFAVVFLVGCEDGFLPLRFGQASTNEDEERRLFFVGMTRARSHLFLSWARKRVLRGEPRVTELSPFIGDIAPELLARQRAEYKARRTAAASGEQLTLL